MTTHQIQSESEGIAVAQDSSAFVEAVETVDAAKAADVPQTAPTTDEMIIPDHQCDRCGSTEDWGMANWCPTCGYYPTFDSKPENVDPSLAFLDVDNTAKNLWELMPRWGWETIAGAGVVLALNVVYRIFLYFYGGSRISVAIGELVISVAAILVAHFRVSMLATNLSTKYTPTDMVMQPLKMWQPTFIKLPTGKELVFAAVWGLTGVFCSIFVLSGIPSIFEDPWVDYTPQGEKFSPTQVVAQAAGAAPAKEGTLDEMVSEMAGNPAAAAAANAAGGKKGGKEEDDQPVDTGRPDAAANLIKTECVVFGYLNDEDKLDRVLLAKNVDGKFRHVATIYNDHIDADLRRMLHVKLKERKQDDPFLDSIHRGIWTEPSVFVMVSYEGWTLLNRMTNAWITEITTDLRKRTDKKRR